jgi:hypothetical protein
MEANTENIIDAIITAANNSLSTEWYRLTASPKLRNQEFSGKQKESPSDNNVKKLPLIWIPDNIIEKPASEEVAFDKETINLSLFFVYKSDQNKTWQWRKTNIIDTYIMPFVNEFLEKSNFSPALNLYRSDQFQHEIEYHANFGAKLNDAHSLTNFTDAVQLKINRFHFYNITKKCT